MKGLIVFSHGMEDVEALATKALLVRAGFEMIAGTYEQTLDIVTAYKQKVSADQFIELRAFDDFDFLVIPGGPYVAKIIDHDLRIQQLARRFYDADKAIAAICAAPRFLGREGLLDGRTFTTFAGCEIDMPKGRYRDDLKAVTDQRIITARGAGAVYEFSYQIVKYLSGEKTAQALLESILF